MAASTPALRELARVQPLKPVELLALGYLSYEDLSAYDVFRKFETGYQALRPWFVWNKRSVYNTVARLQDNGRIEVACRRSDGRRPPKTVYRMTEKGRAALCAILLRDWQNPTVVISNLFPDMFFSRVLDRDALIASARSRVAWIDASIRVLAQIGKIQPSRVFRIILEGRIDTMKALRRTCVRFLEAVSTEDLDVLFRRRAVSAEQATKELSRRLGSRRKRGPGPRKGGS
jgi:DNA-binding PadR family transcriptional regulator